MYKRQVAKRFNIPLTLRVKIFASGKFGPIARYGMRIWSCLLYTSDAADDTPCVDLGGRRIIKKKIFF
ncbi:hypothetical protein JMUB7516_27230 [Staphylococcus aureus]